MPLLSLLLVLAASSGPSVADMPPVPKPPMEADDGATAYACTLEKIGHGEPCGFEGKQSAPGPDQAGANSRAAQDAARGCDLENAAAAKECRRRIKLASETRACTLQGRARLVDDEGRLTAAASGCVDALRAAFNHAAKLDGLSAAPCCECLAAAHCGVTAAECSVEVLELKPGRKVSACLQRSCGDECSFLPRATAPAPAEEDDAKPGPSPKSHRASVKVPNKI